MWLACFLRSGFEFFLCVCVVKKFFKYFRFSLLSLSQKNFTQCQCGMLANFKKGKDWNLLVSLKMPLGSSQSYWLCYYYMKEYAGRFFWQVSRGTGIQVSICQHFNKIKCLKNSPRRMCSVLHLPLCLGQWMWHAWKLACVFRWFDLSCIKLQSLI